MAKRGACEKLVAKLSKIKFCNGIPMCRNDSGITPQSCLVTRMSHQICSPRLTEHTRIMSTSGLGSQCWCVIVPAFPPVTGTRNDVCTSVLHERANAAAAGVENVQNADTDVTESQVYPHRCKPLAHLLTPSQPAARRSGAETVCTARRLAHVMHAALPPLRAQRSCSSQAESGTKKTPHGAGLRIGSRNTFPFSFFQSNSSGRR